MVEYAKGYGKILPKNFEENLTSLFSNMFSDKENTFSFHRDESFGTVSQ